MRAHEVCEHKWTLLLDTNVAHLLVVAAYHHQKDSQWH